MTDTPKDDGLRWAWKYDDDHPVTCLRGRYSNVLVEEVFAGGSHGYNPKHGHWVRVELVEREET